MAFTDQAWVRWGLCSWVGISQTDPREKEESSKDSGGKKRAPEGEGLALAQGSHVSAGTLALCPLWVPGETWHAEEVKQGTVRKT